MKRKVYLIDLKNDVSGHYHIMKALSIIEGSQELDTGERKFHKDTPVKMLKERIRIINSVARNIKDDKCAAHFLTADKFYFLPFLFGNKFGNRRLIATIHRIPKTKMLKWLLKCFSRKVDTIIVLSGYMEECLRNIGISNVHTIIHPAFYNCSDIDRHATRNKYGLKDSDVVFSILGSTRADKGIDIALDAFMYISDSVKKNMVLNIAGREQDVSRHTIIEKARKAGIRIIDNIKCLSIREFKENIRVTDYMLCPYTKKFRGMSGPMCEAFGNGIPCIMPSYGALGWFSQREGDVFSFQIENAQSLARCLTTIMQKRPQINHDFSNMFRLEYFIEEHKKLYYK
ncbi:MAG: glycosyltransferase family 4 protein [Prevotella sp.]|nr:glycosyltransferase family 4 protein [Prevotella sp.]